MEHEALLYRTPQELAAGVRAHVERGFAAGAAVAVAVPGRSARVLRAAFGPDVERLLLLDMEQVGRNPGRIIPTLRDWAAEHHGRPLSFVGEPIWPGRGARETTEAHRHEALLNLAFADTPIHILCPYDAAGLEPGVVADAECTHPVMLADGVRRSSLAYQGPLPGLDAVAAPLPAPPQPVPELPVTDDLSLLRRFVRAHASAADLPAERLEDLLVAANEAATNTLVHGGRDGVVRVWRDDGALVCEVSCSGRISDPLAGRRRPGTRGEGGRGLWLINQLCDLVELRAGRDGTTLRLHIAAA